MAGLTTGGANAATGSDVLPTPPASQPAEPGLHVDTTVSKLRCQYDLPMFDWFVHNVGDQPANFSVTVNGKTVVRNLEYLPGENNSGSQIDGVQLPFGLRAGQPYTVTALVNDAPQAEATGVTPKCTYGFQGTVSRVRCVAGKPMVEWAFTNAAKYPNPGAVLTADGRALEGNHFYDPGSSARGTVNLLHFYKVGEGYSLYKLRQMASDGHPAFGTVPDCSNRQAKYIDLKMVPMLNPLASLRLAPGYVVTADTGTWSPKPSAISVQWFRMSERPGSRAVLIAGATGTTFALTKADKNKRLLFKVTVTRPGFKPTFAYSRPQEIAMLGLDGLVPSPTQS